MRVVLEGGFIEVEDYCVGSVIGMGNMLDKMGVNGIGGMRGWGVVEVDEIEVGV